MAGLSIRVYKYDAATKEMRKVSAREWSVDKTLIDTRWPLCECYRCQGSGSPARRCPNCPSTTDRATCLGLVTPHLDMGYHR